MFNIEIYLEGQKEQVIIVLKYNILKTIRFENIIEYIRRQDKEVRQREYFLIRYDYA